MDASPDRRARLNLFAFPSDADFRFALLVASVLGAALLLYADLFETLPPTARARRDVYAACTAVDDPDDLSGRYEEVVGRYLHFSQCVAPADRGEAAWMVGGATLVVAAAAGLYWAMPAWRIRRQRLRPLDADVGPELVAALDELVAEAGLAGRPHFLWDPLDPTADGLAFGRLGRRCVALTGGLVMQFYADRPAFRAVVLHELGHLRNADLDKTYLTVAIWWAFLGLAVAPAILARLAFSHSPAELARLAWLVLPLAALVRLTRDAVLRARELYADARVAAWDGPDGALDRVLAGLADPTEPRWRRVLRVHPGPGERRRALADCRPLLRMGGWEALAAGAAAGVALPNLVVLLGLLIPFSGGLARPLLAALVLAPLAVGVVGLGIWRQTFAELAAGDRPVATGRLALGLALGFVLGENLTFTASQLARGAWMLDGPALVALELGWGALLLLALWPFLGWIRAGAAAWLEVAASPRPAYLLGLAIASALLALWSAAAFVPYLAVRLAGRALLSPTLGDAFAGALAAPASGELAVGSRQLLGDQLSVDQLAALVGAGVVSLPLVSLVTLWAYPLAAWLVRPAPASAGAPSWAYLDAAPASTAVRGRSSLAPGAALRVGGLLGLVGMAAGLVVVRAGPEPLLAAGLAVLVQPVAAAAVAFRAGRLAALQGLFAAAVAGTTAEVGWLALGAALGWISVAGPLLLAAQLAVVLTVGGAVALGAGALGAWLGRCLRAAPATPAWGGPVLSPAALPPGAQAPSARPGGSPARRAPRR